MKNLYKYCSLLFLPVVIVLYAHSAGSPGGKSGSPGDSNATCTQCHSGTASSVSGWITTNIPAEGYTPGGSYVITATGTHAGVVKFGFELTAETSAGAKIGTFTITEPTRTQLVNVNKAVTHTQAGNVPTGNTNTWTMNWTAPASNVGQIRFYAAFNAANGNGNNTGDIIYKSNLFVDPFTPAALLSVVPNAANQGSNPTLTITGQNTSWNGNNPAVSLRNVASPAEIITATSVTVNSNTQLQANFSIPNSASPGFWDVVVDDLELSSGFSVIELVTTLVSVDPEFGEQGTNPTLTIVGQNTSWNGTNPIVTLRNVVTPSEIITASSVTVNSDTQLQANISIPMSASAGLWDVLVDDLELSSSFSVVEVVVALVSVNPNNADQGSNPTLTITGQNTSWNGTNPTVVLRNIASPSEILTATSVTVNTDTQLHADFTIPVSASAGLWDLLVDDLELSSSFSIIALVPELVSVTPDNADQGSTLPLTISGQNTHWDATTPIVRLRNVATPSEIIEATLVTVNSDLQLIADFTIPVSGSPGLWDVLVDELLLASAFTVNQLAPSLISIVPNIAVQGEIVVVTITAENTFWEGTSPVVYLEFSGGSSATIEAQTVSVVNNNLLTASFNIPLAAEVGLYDVFVNEAILQNGFTVSLYESINSVSINALHVYPNPVVDRLWLNITEPATIRLIDLNGQVVLDETFLTGLTPIMVSQYKRGVYMLDMNSVSQRKFIKLILR
ncbi:MAG: T9SS type A sorting domain-containing protein [Bacteroidales bacterium]|nr:T9SS type A sorting domain-containing protein [Bacteroidales bacterium]